MLDPFSSQTLATQSIGLYADTSRRKESSRFVLTTGCWKNFGPRVYSTRSTRPAESGPSPCCRNLSTISATCPCCRDGRHECTRKTPWELLYFPTRTSSSPSALPASSDRSDLTPDKFSASKSWNTFF